MSSHQAVQIYQELKDIHLVLLFIEGAVVFAVALLLVSMFRR